MQLQSALQWHDFFDGRFVLEKERGKEEKRGRTQGARGREQNG